MPKTLTHFFYLNENNDTVAHLFTVHLFNVFVHLIWWFYWPLLFHDYWSNCSYLSTILLMYWKCSKQFITLLNLFKIFVDSAIDNWAYVLVYVITPVWTDQCHFFYHNIFCHKHSTTENKLYSIGLHTVVPVQAVLAYLPKKIWLDKPQIF